MKMAKFARHLLALSVRRSGALLSGLDLKLMKTRVKPMI